MRRVCLLVLVLMGIALSWGARAADNLVKNPGFEKWPPRPGEGETVWGAEGFSVGVEGREGAPDGTAWRTGQGEMDTERHSGKYAQYIETHTYGRGAIASGIPVLKGYRYRISVWAKIMTGTFRLNACFAHAPWTYLGEWVEGQADGEWKQYTIEVDIPEECQGIAVTMFIQNGSGYLDDLEVVEVGPAEQAEAEATAALTGKLARQVTRKRVAIFDQPGFPSESPRPVEWYVETLKGAGFQVMRLDLAKLLNPRMFNRRLYDTLIIPTGGNMPADLEKSLVQFLGSGGTVLIDGNMVLRSDSKPPEEVRTQMENLCAAYEKGGDAFAYWDFVAKNDTPEYANVFVFDQSQGQWRPKLAARQSYEYVHFEDYLRDLFLRPWPNTGQTIYARPFAEAVHRNEALGGFLADFPESFPANPSAPPALRLGKPGGQGHNTSQSPESALDLVLPLYLFPDVSHDAYWYSSFRDSGKDAKDRETDFYIVRYNNPLLRGGTLIHMGNLGSRMLASDEGARLLLALLRLAESELPGEPPAAFVDHVLEARRLFSDYAGASLLYRDVIQKLARLALYKEEQGGEQGNKNGAQGVKELERRFLEEKAAFESLAGKSQELEALLVKPGEGSLTGDASRVALIADLKKALADLDRQLPALQKQLAGAVTSPQEAGITHPLGRIFIGLGNAVTYRGAFRAAALRERTSRMGLPWEGYGVSSYRHEYTFNKHPFKSEFESGALDPRTGVVEPVKFEWMTTDEERDLWSKSFRWQLERAAKDPDINIVYGMDERNLAFSLWGPRERRLFLDHLQKKYGGDISRLNAEWGSDYRGFEEITLPVKRPETRVEHALWEDWTRYREIYRYEDEMMPSITTVQQYAPNELYLTWSTNYLNEKNPASGLNFYEYGKALHDHTVKFQINGFEHANRPDKEWLTFDIVSMFSRNCCAEWGAFYFPPPGHQEKVDLLSESLWNGIVNGQVGWDLFQFSSPGGQNASYFDMVDLPLPLGWQLALLHDDFQKLAPIVLDGTREEPPIRIVYSNTNRRHTCWPDAEGDISYMAVGGLYDFFKRVHIPARAIDEQAVWEGHLSKDCRLLIIPEVQFQNREFFEKARQYLEAGGSVLVTTDTGKFDEYGRRVDSWFGLAGVKPVASGSAIPLGDGRTYFSRANAGRMIGLEPVFPGEVEVLTRYKEGIPALTRTVVGKGNLFVLGVDLGRDCALQWATQPETVLQLLAPVFRLAGIAPEITVDVPRIAVRAWQYQGRKFLFLTDPGRTDFQEFEMTLAGDWSVKDYLLGAEVPVEFDGRVTRLRGLMVAPGGLVLELKKGDRTAGKAAKGDLLRAGDPPQAVAEARGESAEEKTLPFEGRIWVDGGEFRAGDFTIQLDVETGGGWGGGMFMTVSHGEEQFRRRVTAGDETIFEFTDKRLTARILETVTVNPGNILCKLEASEIQPTAEKCVVRQEDFLGQKSVFVSNGLIAFRVLPGLGGRMIELLSLPDGINHLAVNEDLVRKGPVSQGWADFGGLAENAGAWPGPFWNQPFTVVKIDESPEEARVRLEMAQPVSWRADNATPPGGSNRLTKEFILRKGESRVGIHLWNENADSATRWTGLRIHPRYRVGGDAETADTWVVPGKEGILERTYPFGGAGSQLQIPPAGNWTALIDTAKRIALINTFAAGSVGVVYLNSQPDGYNVELWATPREIPAAGTFEFTHALTLLRGLSGVLGDANGVAGNIELRSGPLARPGQPLQLAVQAGSASTGDFQVRTEIRRGDAVVAALDPVPIHVLAGRAVTVPQNWEVGNQPAGEYDVALTILDANAQPLLQVVRPFQVTGKSEDGAQSKTIGEFEGRLQQLREAYTRNPDKNPEMRARIVRGEILLDEFRRLQETGGRTQKEAAERGIRAILDQK